MVNSQRKLKTKQLKLPISPRAGWNFKLKWRELKKEKQLINTENICLNTQRVLSMEENQNTNWQKTPCAVHGLIHIETGKLKKEISGNCGNCKSMPPAVNRG